MKKRKSNYKYKDIGVSDLVEISYLYMEAYNQSDWNELWDINIAYTRLQEFFSSKTVFGIACLHNNSIQGVLIYELTSWDNGMQCEIKEVFVSPSNRHKGIGKALFAELEKRCEKKNVVSYSLWTADNDSLISFYTKMGFSINNHIIQMTK